MMKKAILLTMSMVLIAPFCLGQNYTVNISRPSKLTTAASKLTVTGPGEKSIIVKNNSGAKLEGTLPADSIIELSVKKGVGKATKYFLYPYGSTQYSLETKVGVIGVAITDLTPYPGMENVPPKKRNASLLPKGFKIAKNLNVSYIHEKTLKSDEIRKQWARQGGKLTGRSLTYLGTFGSITMKEPTLKTTTLIIGGGWTYTQNHYNLTIPEYKPGIASWKSFIYGYAGSINLHMAQVKFDPPPLPDWEAVASGSFVTMFTGNIGYTFGLGKFKTEADYNGLALDLTYKPSLTYTFGPGGSEASFNYMGFGFDISRTSFSAFANRIAPKAKSKFSFFFLPPVKENAPLLITFGYGLVWYR